MKKIKEKIQAFRKKYVDILRSKNISYVQLAKDLLNQTLLNIGFLILILILLIVIIVLAV